MQKKNALLTSLAVLASLTLCQSQSLNDGLVASYSFSGSANDASGKNNHALLTGTTLTTDRFGTTGSAYSFNGTTDYITTPVSSIPTGKLSLCAWVKTQTPASNQFFGVVYSRSAKDVANGITIWNATSGAREGKWIVADVNAGNVLVTQSYTDASKILDNTWHFIAYTYDGSVQRVYVDGTLSSEVTKGINQVVNAPFIIGYDNIEGYNRYFKGAIDDVRIYDRAISGSEVLALKNLTSATCTQTITVTDTLVINFTLTGYNPVSYSNTIKVYPNPTSSHITIDHGDVSKMQGCKIAILDNKGQSVYASDITQTKADVDLTKWSGTGIYFLYLYDAKGYTVDIRKIVLN